MKKVALIAILLITACVPSRHTEMASARSVSEVAERRYVPNENAWLEEQITLFNQEIIKQYGEQIGEMDIRETFNQMRTITGLNADIFYVNKDLIQLSFFGSYSGSHNTIVREYRLLDTKRRKVVRIDKLLKENIKQKMTAAMYQKLLAYQHMGWRGTPQNEAERQNWLVHNMPYVFQYGGYFEKNEAGQLRWSFCSQPTQDNAYQACSYLDDVKMDELFDLQ